MKKFLFAGLILASTLALGEKGRSSASEGEKPSVKVGLGFASYGGAALLTPAFSSLIQLADVHSVQVAFGITSTAVPTLGGSIHYRMRFAGEASSGAFHGGLGINLGTNGGTFTMSVYPLAGLHLKLLSNLMLHLDGGPIFNITPTFSFAMMPLGGLFGAAIHYIF